MSMLPQSSEARKDLPVTTGVLDYFPDAIAYVAYVSKIGNDKHNPGQPLHWARGKGGHNPDCVGRHLIERGTYDADGLLNEGTMAWRSLACLQLKLEELNAAGLDIWAPFGGTGFEQPTVQPMPALTIDEHAHGDDHHAHDQAAQRQNAGGDGSGT